MSKWTIEVITKAPGAMEASNAFTLHGDAWFTWEDGDFVVIETGTAQVETIAGEDGQPDQQVPADDSINQIQSVLRVPRAHVRSVRVALAATQTKAAER